MSGVRDPAFWKRFSTAVHLDQEAQSPSSQGSPAMKREDEWLYRQGRKKRWGCVCWSFWICFFLFAAIVVVVIIWLIKAGYFAELGDKINEALPPVPNATPAATSS
ncbi:hypothetical protein MBLNU457_3139t1 [Dothideomycetes sp. NU457]